MDLSNKSVTVVGLGKSGLAAVKKLAAAGAKVFATDSGSPEVSELQLLGVQLELGGHTLKSIADAELVVVSPGVHLDIPIITAAKERKIRVVSEIELAYYFLKKPIIAVTGTNGKTTTTTLIGEMLKAAGLQAAVAGNIGAPLIAVDDSGLDFIVAEISSYQLEAIADFKPLISMFLNIQPDHLERHHTMEEYAEQKGPDLP